MAQVPPTSLEQTARVIADSAEIAHGLAAVSEQQGEPDHVELFTRVARDSTRSSEPQTEPQRHPGLT